MPNKDDIVDNGLSARIEAAIAAGLAQGRAELARKRRRKRQRGWAAGMSGLLLVSCLLTIRVSPGFAAWVGGIPGFEKFVELVNRSYAYDKGVGLALDNDLAQPLNVSDAHDGVTLSVRGAIADESRVVLFYEIRSAEPDDGHMLIGSNRIVDREGRELPVTISYNYPSEDEQNSAGTGVRRGTVDFAIHQTGSVLPEEWIWEAEISGTGGSKGTTFSLPVSIDRAKFAGTRREFALGRTVVAEGQSITFVKAVVTPLRVALYLEYDASNAKQVFGPGDLKLVDERGRAWNQTSGSLEGDRPVYYFESPYFEQPEALTIEGSWFRALDKSRLTVTVDTQQMKLLQAPDGKLSLVGGGLHRKLTFGLKDVDPSDNMVYSLLFQREFSDADGNRYQLDYMGATLQTRTPDEQTSTYQLDGENYRQPLTFRIADYPAYIRQSYRIPIAME